ncbi:MAG TPA: transposase [Thermoanaerobaculia bacterium]|nr:transposase [Thermoanaerobaculia bacterium]
MRYDNVIPPPTELRIHSRGRLPHWRVDHAVYFITFRLRDSLPVHIADKLYRERLDGLRRCRNGVDRARVDEEFGLRLDSYLDQHWGSAILRQHGELVAGALKFFDRDRYELHAWCVMPNHVHVMFYVDRGDDVPRILHSWKSYTAHEIGRKVWQREYFDRIVRSPRELESTAGYIRANPGKAGLENWRWVG